MELRMVRHAQNLKRILCHGWRYGVRGEDER